MTNKIYERNNSCDIINSKSIRRILTKRQNEFFNELNTINTINEK